MKGLLNKRLVVAVLTIACLTAVLLIVTPIRSSSPSAGEYDPWLDWNDDGKIDMRDIGGAARAYGASGQNVSKASLVYDSGWLDLRNETGETYTITHNLNDTELLVDARELTPVGWNKTYGGTYLEAAGEIVQTSDGGYALAGDTNSSGSPDFWLVKTDATGNIQWNQTYGGTDQDYATALVQTNDGGYALVGSTRSFGAGSWDTWLVKTDDSGNMQWNKTYGGIYDDDAQGLVQTGDDGFAIAGETTSFGAGEFDFWLVKTDDSGNMQWNKTYGGTYSHYAEAFVRTSDGGYAITGYTGPPVSGGMDFWLVKTDASGNAQWNMTYGGTNEDYPFALVQTGDDGFAIAGETTSFGAGEFDFWLVKTDDSGNMQWNKTYGGTDEDCAFGLVQTIDGGYAMTGDTESFGAGQTDFWLVKTDASGNAQWNMTYGGPKGDYANALVQTIDGGYALAGGTYSFGAGMSDFWLVKTDAAGNVGGVESGLAWVDSSANAITLYRGATDTSWNYVRVRLLKPR